MKQWWSEHGLVLTITFGAISLFGLVAMIVVLARLPADYFLRPPERSSRFAHLHPALRLMLRIGRNGLGFLLIVLGIVLSLPLVPGPGLLSILLGVSLMNFPGKRKFQIALLRTPGVCSQITRIRKHFGRPPLDLPHRPKAADKPAR